MAVAVIVVIVASCWKPSSGQLRKRDAEIRRLQDGMTAEDSQARTDILRDRLLDGARKAESTRAKERVKRIALILANGTVEPTQPNPDELER